MKRISPLLLLSACALLSSCAGGGESSHGGSSLPEPPPVYDDVPPESATPYRGAAACRPVYQILVYSFADSNGDGVGDFQGIVDRLDYLSSLNVGYLWLSPIHPSGSYHHYDVEDYSLVDPLYGGEEGLRALIEEAKKRDIGIVMDLVFNHASSESAWFKESVESFAYHVQQGTLEAMKADPENIGNDFVLSTNAEDIGRGVKSLYVNGTTVYYEANFSSNMPEFNLDSPSVKRKQADIMARYLGMGVAGFRFDGCYYFHLGDEEKSVAYMDYLAEEARKIKEDVLLIGEYWNGGSQATYDNAISKMAIFNFPTSMASMGEGSPIQAARTGNNHSFASALYRNQFAALTHSGGIVHPTYFLNNHDVDRFKPSSLGEAKAIAAGYLLTPGTPTIYYGEEIALRGKRSSSDNTDANRRLPMRWLGDAQQDAYRCAPPTGGSDPGDQVSVGALEEIEKEGTLAAYYRDVLAFRAQKEELREGLYLTYGDERETLSINRIVHDGKTKGFLVHNFDYDPHQSGILPAGLRLDTTLSLGEDRFEDGILTLSPFSTVYLEVNA